MKTILKGIGMGSCCFIGGLFGSVLGTVFMQMDGVQEELSEEFKKDKRKRNRKKEPVTIGFTGSLHRQGEEL